MKHYLDLVPLSARVHRRQSRMTRLCILLGVFLVAVMFGLADMYLQGMTEETRRQTGDWHCRFAVSDADAADLIAARPEVACAAWQGSLAAGSGVTLQGRPAAVCGLEPDAFARLYLGGCSSGRAPAAAGETALSEALAQAAGLAVGDTARLALPDGRTAELLVTGILDGGSAARLAPGSGTVLLVTPRGLVELESGSLAADWQVAVQFVPLCDMSAAAADIQRQNGLTDDQVTLIQELLSMLNQLPGSNTEQIYQVAFVLSLVVMAACILMISSSLNSNVSQRTRFFGMLRCLGATRRQILRFVRREALQWCAAALPAGIGLSIVVVWALCAVMRRISPVWFGYMPAWGVSWPAIAAGVLLGLATVLLAARAPARMAARVSPLQAVSGSAGQQASFRHGADTRRLRVETALGIHHAKAKRRSFVLMTGAFALCITMFLGFSTLVPFMENAFKPRDWTPELSIVSETNTCSIPADRKDAVAQLPAVKRVYGRSFAYDLPLTSDSGAATCNLISYDEQQFAWARQQLAAGSIDAVADTLGQVLLVAGGNVQAQVGDPLLVQVDGRQQAVTVGGILSGSPLARADGVETLICSEQTFAQLSGQTGYTILDVQFRFGAGESDAAAVQALFSGGVTFRNDLTQVQQQRGLYYAFAVLVYGFLSIIVAITVFHIMNTIDLGVSARTRQYGVMRAIGMSGRQLTRMVAAEAAAYAAGGVTLGCALGLALHWFLYSSLVSRTFGVAWGVPWPELALIVAVILLTSALAVRRPARRLLGLSIVDAIAAQ